ncbi:{NirD} Ferredoxin subunits of nitrite reductase and ring-hydroxylating dioxygenases [Oxalobacteraceae bacterium]|jgi:nitrite reductase/ring-hydroxylating ferredoxin subunit
MSEAIYICDSESLDEGGKGIRFPVTVDGDDLTAFVVRYGLEPRAYLNRCAHLPMELDWTEGEFFESSGLYLMCATHGALYEPDTGHCAGGPCRGGRLHAINVIERDKKIFWEPDDYVRPARA